MLVYIIVIAELAFLYMVFWYIFLHEPKPFTIDTNLWGKYQTNKIIMSDDLAQTESNTPSYMPSCLQLNFYLRKSKFYADNEISTQPITTDAVDCVQPWQLASIPIISHFFLLLSKSLEDQTINANK